MTPEEIQKYKKKYGLTTSQSSPVDISSLRQKYGGQSQIENDKKTVSATPLGTSPLASVVSGLAKGGLSTLKGLSSLGEKVLRTPVDLLKGKSLGESWSSPTSAEQLQSSVEKAKNIQPGTLLEGSNPIESASKAVEQIAEFLAPSGLATKGEKFVAELTKTAPKLLKKTAPILTKMAGEAGIVGTQSAVQQGGNFDNTAKTNAILAAAFPVLGKAISGIADVTGSSIVNKVIKPLNSHFEDGFKIETIRKYGLTGSLRTMMSKTTNKMNELSQQLRTLLKAGDVPVDLNKVFEDTYADLMKNRPRNFGNTSQINKVLSHLAGELDTVAPNMEADLLTATDIKRGAGTKGAWVFNSPDPDATAVEKVYTTFYNKLKTAIEEAGGKEIQDINKQLSELIPVQDALLRRIPVAERNNLLNLTDNIGLFASVFDPRALALVGAKKLSESARVGGMLIKAAEIMKNTPEAVKHLPIGITSQLTK